MHVFRRLFQPKFAPDTGAGAAADTALHDRQDDVLSENNLSDDGADTLSSGLDAFHEALKEISSDEEAPALPEEEEEEADGQSDWIHPEDDPDYVPADEEAGEEDGEQEDTEQNEQTDEEEESQEKASEPNGDLSKVLDAINGELGLKLTSSEELVKTVQEEIRANEELVQLYERVPELMQITRAVMAGTDLYEAVVEALGELDDDNPDLVKARAKQEAKRELLADQVQSAKTEGEKDRVAFQESQKLSDEQMDAFLDRAKAYVYGDPTTGRLPTDFLDVLWRGLRYDDDVKRAAEEAAKKGKNDAVNELRNKRKRGGDSVPYARSGKSQTSSTPREASLDDLAASLQRNDLLENF